MDVISLCSELIKCKSVTPNDDGAIDTIANYLSSFGFQTTILESVSSNGKNRIKNLFAKYGTSKNKILGFLGHSDVVPAGDNWEVEPFSAIQKDGYLIGRGVNDMKGGVAAFCCAATQFIKTKFDGTLEIFITGDEEVGSYEGARSLLKWCEENNNLPHDCLIGEPSSNISLGDRAYIGHRGSMNVGISSIGKQGHVAYLGSYENSLTNVCRYIVKMLDYKWDHVDKKFAKTNIEPTVLFTDNYATNVAPNNSSAVLNIRYGSDYTAESLKKIFLKEAEELNVSLDFNISGNSYCCDDERLKKILSTSIKKVLGIDVEFSCGGGISDGRYMRTHCNVIEFGLLDSLIHQKNEKAKIEDLFLLEKVYLSFIEQYFQSS